MSQFALSHQTLEPSIADSMIEEKRRQLLRTAEEYGMLAPKTLACSQELDQMIVAVQEKAQTQMGC